MGNEIEFSLNTYILSPYSICELSSKTSSSKFLNVLDANSLVALGILLDVGVMLGVTLGVLEIVGVIVGVILVVGVTEASGLMS